jgi:hypothetical protein
MIETELFRLVPDGRQSTVSTLNTLLSSGASSQTASRAGSAVESINWLIQVEAGLHRSRGGSPDPINMTKALLGPRPVAPLPLAATSNKLRAGSTAACPTNTSNAETAAAATICPPPTGARERKTKAAPPSTDAIEECNQDLSEASLQQPFSRRSTGTQSVSEELVWLARSAVAATDSSTASLQGNHAHKPSSEAIVPTSLSTQQRPSHVQQQTSDSCSLCSQTCAQSDHGRAPFSQRSAATTHAHGVSPAPPPPPPRKHRPAPPLSHSSSLTETPHTSSGGGHQGQAPVYESTIGISSVDATPASCVPSLSSGCHTHGSQASSERVKSAVDTTQSYACSVHNATATATQPSKHFSAPLFERQNPEEIARLSSQGPILAHACVTQPLTAATESLDSHTDAASSNPLPSMTKAAASQGAHSSHTFSTLSQSDGIVTPMVPTRKGPVSKSSIALQTTPQLSLQSPALVARAVSEHALLRRFGSGLYNNVTRGTKQTPGPSSSRHNSACLEFLETDDSTVSALSASTENVYVTLAEHPAPACECIASPENHLVASVDETPPQSTRPSTALDHVHQRKKSTAPHGATAAEPVYMRMASIANLPGILANKHHDPSRSDTSMRARTTGPLRTSVAGTSSKRDALSNESSDTHAAHQECSTTTDATQAQPHRRSLGPDGHLVLPSPQHAEHASEKENSVTVLNALHPSLMKEQSKYNASKHQPQRPLGKSSPLVATLADLTNGHACGDLAVSTKSQPLSSAHSRCIESIHFTAPVTVSIAEESSPRLDDCSPEMVRHGLRLQSAQVPGPHAVPHERARSASANDLGTRFPSDHTLAYDPSGLGASQWQYMHAPSGGQEWHKNNHPQAGPRVRSLPPRAGMRRSSTLLRVWGEAVRGAAGGSLAAKQAQWAAHYGNGSE